MAQRQKQYPAKKQLKLAPPPEVASRPIVVPIRETIHIPFKEKDFIVELFDKTTQRWKLDRSFYTETAARRHLKKKPKWEFACHRYRLAKIKRSTLWDASDGIENL